MAKLYGVTHLLLAQIHPARRIKPSTAKRKAVPQTVSRDKKSKVRPPTLAFPKAHSTLWRFQDLTRMQRSMVSHEQYMKLLEKSTFYRTVDTVAHLFGAYDERTAARYRGGLVRGIELLVELEAAVR